MGCCIGNLHTVETRFYCMGFGFELDTTDFLYKECVIRKIQYNFFPKKTYFTRVIRNGLSSGNIGLKNPELAFSEVEF